MAKLAFTPPTVLGQQHDLSTFKSSSAILNTWLRKKAKHNHGYGYSRVFVVTPKESNQVVAYYCLSAGSVQRRWLPNRVARNAPDPVPAVVLGRLAVDQKYEGLGLGRGLVNHAVTQTLIAANAIGVRVLIVKAKDENAFAFYRDKCGFLELPDVPLTLIDPLPKCAV